MRRNRHAKSLSFLAYLDSLFKGRRASPSCAQHAERPVERLQRLMQSEPSDPTKFAAGTRTVVVADCVSGRAFLAIFFGPADVQPGVSVGNDDHGKRAAAAALVRAQSVRSFRQWRRWCTTSFRR